MASCHFTIGDGGIFSSLSQFARWVPILLILFSEWRIFSQSFCFEFWFQWYNHHNIQKSKVLSQLLRSHILRWRKYFPDTSRQANEGIQLFFLLSGFIIFVRAAHRRKENIGRNEAEARKEGVRMADDCSLAPFTDPTLSKDKRLQYVEVEYFPKNNTLWWFGRVLCMLVTELWLCSQSRYIIQQSCPTFPGYNVSNCQKKHSRVNQYIISINTWKQYIVRVRTPPSNTLYQIQHRSISAQAQAGWSPCVRWLWWWTINSSPLAPYSPTLWHYYTELLWWIRALSTCVRLPILA